MRPYGRRESEMSDFVPPYSRRQFLKIRISSEVSDIPSDGFEVIIIGVGRRAVVIVGFVACLFVVEVIVRLFCWCCGRCVACRWAVVRTVFGDYTVMPLVAAMDRADVLGFEAWRSRIWLSVWNIIIIIIIISITLVIIVISVCMYVAWCVWCAWRLVAEDVEILREFVDALRW